VIVVGYVSLLAGSDFAPIESVSKQVISARKEAQMLYKNLAIEGQLKKLGLPAGGELFDGSNKSETLFCLIEWIESRGDIQSKQLLSAINKLFYLKLHQLLSGIDTKNNDQRGDQSTLFVRDLRALYTHCVDGVFPFQTMLTKTMLQLVMVYAGGMSLQERNELILLVLQQTQDTFIKTNNLLKKENKIDEHIINGFIDGLSRHALAPEKENSFTGIGKKLVTATIVVGSIAMIMGVAYYLMNRFTNNLAEKQVFKDLISQLKPEALQTALENAGKAIIKDGLDRVHNEFHGEINDINGVLAEFAKQMNIAVMRFPLTKQGPIVPPSA